MEVFIAFAKETGLYVQKRKGRVYIDVPGDPGSPHTSALITRLASAARSRGLRVEEGLGRLYLAA